MHPDRCDLLIHIAVAALRRGDDEVEHGEGDHVPGAGGAGVGLGRAVDQAWPSLPDCLLTVYLCTRTHSPRPPP